MGYKPTLGGLKKAQEFLNLKGHCLPIFQMDIYDICSNGGQLSILGGWVPGSGQTVSIDEAIRKYGTMYKVMDVRLTNERGDKFVRFSDTVRLGIYTGMEARERGWDAAPEYSNKDYQFRQFINSADGMALVSLARWGKANPTILDRITFILFPKYYASKVFV